MKRVFIVTTTYPDLNGFSGGNFIHNQALSLMKRGIHVNVLYYDFRSIRRKRKLFTSSYELDGVEVLRYAFPCGPINILLKLINFFSWKKLYKKALKKYGKPDVLHAHFLSGGKIAYRISRKYKIPFFITEHSSGLIEGEIITKKDSKIYNSSNCVFAVGNALKDRILEFCRCNIEVVPNIIPNYMFGVKTKKIDNCFKFVSIGSLIERKGFDILLRAFSCVENEFKNIQLTIVGDGPLKDDLQSFVINHKLEKKVFFVSKIDNKKLPEIFKVSDCFVLASKYETFGMVYAEAMAAGLPVIATKCGGPEDFVNNSNGIIIEKGNIDLLVDAMKSMINNYDKYDGKEISAHIYSNYSEEHILSLILQKYGEYTK